MRIIRESLRLCEETELSQRDVARSLGVSHSTVCRALQRAAVAGLSAADAAGLTDSELQAALHPGPEATSPALDGRLSPDWDHIEEELTRELEPREVKVTRRRLWKEYRAAAREAGLEAYSYSQFCQLLANSSDGPAARVAMRFEYEPGVWGISDFSGKTLRLRLPDGSEKPVEIFVACLCFSRLVYAEAVADQSGRNWCMAHRRAFEYFGGVPERHRVDCLKSGVIRPGREEFVLNEQFRDLARHYGVAVLPARPGRPRDKGMVEGAVKVVQMVILLALRKVVFFSIEEMNRAIRVELEALNNRLMRGWGVSRRDLFEAQEGVALRPLPQEPWQWYVWLKPRTAMPNGHIRVDKNSYSVPFAWRGHALEVRRTERMLQIFVCRDGERVAVHPIATGINRYITVASHMEEWQKDMQASKGARYEDWLLSEARKTGPQAEAWALRCLGSRDFPPQAFNTLRAMITLASKHGAEAVDDACGEALARERFASGFLREWLQQGRPARKIAERKSQSIPAHRHLRGGSYYRKAGRAIGEGSGT